MASLLIPHTIPKVSFEEEQEVLFLKQRSVTIEGYDLVLCFSKADYDKYVLHSLQVQGVYHMFLPFEVVVKTGRAFLGDRHLAFIDFIKGGRKIYCWTVRHREDTTVPPTSKSTKTNYNGFEFSLLKPGSIDL